MTIISVGELMTENLETISTLSSVQEAAKKMRDNNVSSLVVIDDKNVTTSIVTERDLVRKVCVSGMGSGSVVIKDLMSSPLVTIDARSPVEAAANVMIENKVRHLLVIRDNDITRPLGIITPTDFVGYVKENLNTDNELISKILEFLNEPRGEEIVEELEQQGELQKDSQKGGPEYENEKPRQG